MKEPGWPRQNRPKPCRIWSLWKSGALMECEINSHPLGHELRIYHRGQFQSAQVFESDERAAREAQDRKSEFIAAAGWNDHYRPCSNHCSSWILVSGSAPARTIARVTVGCERSLDVAETPSPRLK